MPIEDYNLCSGAPAILDYFSENFHVKEELLECIVEVNTGICNNINQLYSQELEKTLASIC